MAEIAYLATFISSPFVFFSGSPLVTCTGAQVGGLLTVIISWGEKKKKKLWRGLVRWHGGVLYSWVNSREEVNAT